MLKKQRRLDHPIGGRRTRKLNPPSFVYLRQDQLLQPYAVYVVTEYVPRQLLSADLLVSRYNIGKPIRNPCNHDWIGQHLLANDAVRINPPQPGLLEEARCR